MIKIKKIIVENNMSDNQGGKSQFVQNEEDLLKYWEEKDIFKKTVQKDATQGNFVFFEGPPTANGKPGIHHVIARIFKDAIPRYKTMQGFHVERKAGWDTHGLPVELGVEKQLGMSGKQDIENYGIDEFNKQCKESVWRYKKEWDLFTKRIGYFLDLDDPYITYSNEYMESLWWIIKQIWDKELIYKGYRVVPHCPRCGTSLSTHEVSQGYKNIEETSVYVKFKVKEQDNTYILSWTTTPWTLPGNVALAVGENIEYVKVKKDNDFYIIAKNLAHKIGEGYEVVEEMKGSKLIGLEYEPLYNSLEGQTDKKSHYVAPANFVTIEDGTGVVHTAVMYGVDDYELGKELDLPEVHTVDEEGCFNELVPQWKGAFVKDVEKDIITDLKNRGLLFSTEEYTHDYPFCWRCDTPLLYYAKDSWFIEVTKVKENLIKENKTINWIPSHLKEGRFGEWLNGIKDWNISRERYWGTPLPIWECDSCDHKKCIGSYDELPNKLEDYHRPFVDEISFACKCGGTMKRISEVIDVWFDSGAMPFAQWHYPFENKEKIDNGESYPANFISEAIDQTRGWFYTLLAIAVLLDKPAPYKNVISMSHILDVDGQKMSKSRGNVVDPWEVINTFGVDALRLYLFTVNQPGDTKLFDTKQVQEVFRNFNMTLHNIFTFYALYEKDNKEITKVPEATHIMDKWLLAELQRVTQKVTESLDAYEVTDAARVLSQVVTDISVWYVRLSRNRFKSGDKNVKEVFGYTLQELIKLLAPFVPFMTERLYLDYFCNGESIHLENWPQVQEGLQDEKLLNAMTYARKVVETAHAVRAKAQIKVRQPLPTLVVEGVVLPDNVLELLKQELNVKEVITDASNVSEDTWITKEEGDMKVHLNTAMTDELKKEGLAREIVRHTNTLRKEKGLTIDDTLKQVIYANFQDALLIDAIKEHANTIAENVLAKEIIVKDSLEDMDATVTIEKMEVHIKFVK